ncbi:solute carrier family 15 member 2 [Ictalurus furcatus]|uniref:solute carrier family 15 member 2 n=1 Tax=Ictalurus furcatus TaxID=66913 RepID=UPI00235089B1|nr:solute carrier family 15 member 2 [Ictalurus furcatus]XP_053482546.1 solute carrier family 15 member 2 [Ictalurus furcatus]XP_053482547.1 solute carrier family 15 member 2 [Ictalurus furcatus]
MEEKRPKNRQKSPKICGTNYPLSISFIVVNEFCERFSYYGMKAVLTLYFIHYLHWSKNLSTAIYHAFSGLCYFTPVLGAIIADSWLGKFKTIIYLSIVYVIGHVIKSIGAIPDVGDSSLHIGLSMFGLILIAFGTGGIKPCVSAFGGDQFEEEHTDERRKFFSIFYMSINAGSVLSTLITPILRGDVQCFGGDCYALAFGVPAALMIIALVVFIAGSGLYKKSPPEGNVLLNVCKCIGFAIRSRWRSSKKSPKRNHWLDWAEGEYSKSLIQEIKMVLRVLVLYIPLPMFWALFDQQGSRWTLQATRMNMDFGGFVIKPDQMQMLNALLILVFIPIFDMGVYPLIGLCRINLTPLRKMGAGMILAALAFCAATVVEVNVIKTVVEPPPAKECLLQVLNLVNGEAVSVEITGHNIFPDKIESYKDPIEYTRLPLGGDHKVLPVSVSQNGETYPCQLNVTEHTAYSLILYKENNTINCKQEKDNIIKSENGEAFLRFINTRSENMNITVGSVNFFAPSSYGISEILSVERGKYIRVTCESDTKTHHIDLGLLDFGATYTFILGGDTETVAIQKMEDVHANNVHIAWQIPQYVLITAGEVMFSITGLEFSYSQAPASMKSVLQAGWLLTVAFGNVIVLIVAEGAGLEQWTEFLLFAALLVAVSIIFSIMAYFYTYVDPDQLAKLTKEDNNMADLKEKEKENMDMIDVPKSTKM